MSLFAQQPVTVLSVTGMHCQKCVARVKDALEGVDGVVKVDVDLDAGRAQVTGAVEPAQLTAAVDAIGFGAELA